MIRDVTDEEVAFFERERYVVLPRALFDLPAVVGYVEDLVRRPDAPGRWMRWYETTDRGRQLCRIENFVPYHAGLAELVTGARTMAALERLLEEPACLFKDKINLKLPGGSGFGAHQDAPAFATFGHRLHVTMMVALDDQRTDNGCLEMSDPLPPYEVLPQSPGGTIDAAVEARMPWRPLFANAGDIVFFDSYLPHRSPPNASDRPRRAIYLTYNPLADGDRHTEYFSHKRSVFPPECERVPGVDYSAAAATYNLGNPIR